MTNNNPKIYVGTYNKYNSGSIKGAWLDLTDYADIDELNKAIKELHKDESDPEIMVQDFEYFPKQWYCESYNSDTYAKVIEYANLDEREREIIDDYMENAVGDDRADFSDIIDSVIFEADPDDNDSIETQFGYSEMESLGLDDFIEGYFDFASYGRDLCFNYAVGEKYIFSY